MGTLPSVVIDKRLTTDTLLTDFQKLNKSLKTQECIALLRLYNSRNEWFQLSPIFNETVGEVIERDAERQNTFAAEFVSSEYATQLEAFLLFIHKLRTVQWTQC